MSFPLLGPLNACSQAHAPEEVEDMVKICNCTYINIGTLSKPWVDSMILAAKTADSLHKNWVLDPVAAGVTYPLLDPS